MGLNVEQLLRRLERRPLSGTGDFRNGRTPFEKLTADFKIVGGVATAETVDLEGSKVRLGLTGSASIPARDFDLRGVAALASTNAADAPPRSNCRSWCRAPGMTRFCCPTPRPYPALPGGEPAVERGAQPQHRDTVRSAIERLTGGAVSAPTGAPAADPKP